MDKCNSTDFDKSESKINSECHQQLLTDVFPSRSWDSKLSPEHFATQLQTPHQSLSPFAELLNAGRPEAHSASALVDTVAREFAGGMYDQLKNNPSKVGVEFGLGIAASYAFTALTANSIGHKLLPVIQAAGAAYGLYELGKASLGLADQAATIGSMHSSAEDVQRAKYNIRNSGASTMDFLALSAGASIGMESTRTFLNTFYDAGIGSALPQLNPKLTAIVSSYGIAARDHVLPSGIKNLVNRWTDEADGKLLLENSMMLHDAKSLLEKH